jgi:prepilin-type N-terminal cleavage/methylation domain-containing protein
VKASRLAPSARGFTLLEVMIGLALLGLALTVLIKSSANSIFNARQAQMMGVITDLSRGKIYDIEEKLLKEGFTETDQSEDDLTFEDEGWPNVRYSYKVEQVELPSFDQLQAMALGRTEGSGSAGSAAGSDGELLGGGFQDSALGGLLSQMGGGMGGGEDIDDTMGAAFIQGQYQMVQETLKVSIRKVTLTVSYDVMGFERDLKTVAYFTDASAMDKVLSGLGSQELPEDGGTGSSSGGASSGGASSGGRPGTPSRDVRGGGTR